VLILRDWGSALGFDWANRHCDRVAAIAYMEALVRPIVSWDEWNKAATPIFQGFRSDNGEDRVLNRNLFVERVLPGSILRKLTDEEMTEYRRAGRKAMDKKKSLLSTAMPRKYWPLYSSRNSQSGASNSVSARDHGGLLRIVGLTHKAVQYEIGNSFTGIRMTQYQLADLLTKGVYTPTANTPLGWSDRKGSDYDLADWRRDLEGEGMSTRAADDFEFIRSRMEQLKRERQPAPVQPQSPLSSANESDERVWNWDGFGAGLVCRMRPVRTAALHW
jgi:hypothetical protein